MIDAAGSPRLPQPKPESFDPDRHQSARFLCRRPSAAQSEWRVAGDSNFTWSASTGLALGKPLTMTGGTVTASTPLLDLSQTWNNSGVTFTALKLNVTNTASNAQSALLDAQLGGTSIFKVRRDYYERGFFRYTSNADA